MFNLYVSESHWSELKSDFEEWVLVKSNLVNSLLNLCSCVKLGRANLNEDDNTGHPPETSLSSYRFNDLIKHIDY